MFANAHPHERLRHADERLARARRHAADERLAAEARRRHRLPLRARIAAGLIGLGERLAAEPTLTFERSNPR